MDILGALNARPPQPTAREPEAPKRKPADDGGKPRERFDHALDSAATEPAEESTEPRPPKTRTENAGAKASEEPRPNRTFDREALNSAIAVEDLAKSPRDMELSVSTPMVSVEGEETPAVEAADDIKVEPADGAVEIIAALAPAIVKEPPTAPVNRAVTSSETPVTTFAAAGPALKRASAALAEPVASSLAERVRTAATNEDKALRPLGSTPRASDPTAPIVVRPAAAEIEKPAPDAVALTRVLETSLEHARAAEPQLSAGLASIPELAAKLKLAASPSALQHAADKQDLINSPPPIAAAGDRVALPHDISNQLNVTASAKLEIHQHSPATAADAARQVIAAIRTGAGGDGIEVRLDPPDLGRVRIHFTVDRADSVTAVITSDRSDTLDMMRRHSADLARELARAGFADIHMEFKSGGGDRTQHEAAFEPRNLNGAVIEDAQEATHVVYARARFDGRLDRLV